jgi:hypothetical protein
MKSTTFEVPVYEVHHLPHAHPVYQVAHRAAQHKRNRQGQQAFVRLYAAEEPDNQADGQQ